MGVKSGLRLFVVVAAALLLLPGYASAQNDGDVIRLGAVISLTGAYAPRGQQMLAGYRLAAARINENGGVQVGSRSYRIEIQYYDDESNPSRAAQLAGRLVRQDGVQFLLGPYSSGLTHAVAPVAEDSDVPLVAADGASVLLFTKGYRNVFGIPTPSDRYLTDAVHLIAETARSEGHHPSDITIGMVFGDDTLSQEVRLGVVAVAGDYKMQIVVDETLDIPVSDMSAALEKVRQVRPDILFVSGHADAARTLVQQLEMVGVDSTLIAMTDCDVGDITRIRPNVAEGVICAAQWHPNVRSRGVVFSSSSEFAVQFRQSQDDMHETDILYPVAAQAAAAIVVYENAFERAGSLDRDAVRDALSETDMTSFFGPVRFSADGRNAAKPMYVMQVQDGEYQPVFPPNWAVNPLMRCPPPKVCDNTMFSR